MKHLLSIKDLTRPDIEQLHKLTDSFAEVGRRSIPKVPALRGKNVVWLFYEDSTRTRLSFEQAAKRLSADTMTFSVGSSSVKKGESFSPSRRWGLTPSSCVTARPACRGRSRRGWTDA
jgi:aspartate carbamoyltransferase catalytic subunit